jgi:inorganic pyrophosphatase
MSYVVDALIEIPYGSRNKYEVDKTTGRIRLDRVLYSAMSYPAEYGYIEETLAPDGDPLDILVITSEPTVPGCVVPARLLGYLATMDRGVEDYKLIAVTDCDPRYANVQKLEDLPPFILDEISNFFQNYKVLQNMQVDVWGYFSLDATMKVIEQCRQRYAESLQKD